MKLRNKLHGTALALSLFLLLGTATACGSDNNSDSSEKDSTTTAAESSDETTANDASSASETASSDVLTFVIYPDDAPITCENFENLVSDGFYDGLTFHRIVEDFMAQGGDPSGNGTGGSEKTIKGEFSQNGVDNPLSHTRGVVSMARSSDPDSASSQFFICYSDDDTFLDGQYAAFGHVTEGMDIVDQICKDAKPTDNNGTISADEQPVMTSVTIID